MLDVLLMFRQHDGPLSIDAITDALDIPKSTAYRYTKTLTDRGFLEKGAQAGTYRLGRVFLELGQAVYASNRDLLRAALPPMMALADAIGESVSLMRLMNGRAVCIESIEGRHALRVAIQRGRSQPLHAGASSRLLLAHQPEASWATSLQTPLKPYTENTITHPDTLFDNLREVQGRGYAVSDGEIDSGARAVAVPLWDAYETVVAALSIEAPASRLPDSLLSEYVEQLLATAKVIGEALR